LKFPFDNSNLTADKYIMQATTLQANKATYTNDRYYVHGWKNDRGTFTVVAAKRGQFRRSVQQWISHTSVATYAEATSLFNTLKAQIDATVAAAAAKRSNRSAERSAAIKAYKAATPNPWKVGDICHTSWGYDQTNVDAYQVVEVWSRTQISVRPIGGKVEETGYMCGRFTPQKDNFSGESIKVLAGFGYYPYATGGTNVSESWAVKGHDLYETKPGQSHYFSSYA
jgi:hypothetical protein